MSVLANGAIALALAIFTVAALIFAWRQFIGFAAGEYRREEIFRASDPEDIPPYLQGTWRRVLAILRQLLGKPARGLIFAIVICFFAAYYQLIAVVAQPSANISVSELPSAFSDENIVRALKEQAEAQESIADAIRQQSDGMKRIDEAIRAQQRSEPLVISSTPDGWFLGLLRKWDVIIPLVIIPICIFGLAWAAEGASLNPLDWLPFSLWQRLPNFLRRSFPYVETSEGRFFLRASASTVALASISVGTLITVKELNLFTFNIHTGNGQDKSATIQKVTINLPPTHDKAIRFDCGGRMNQEGDQDSATPETNQNTGASQEENKMRIWPFPAGWADPAENKAHDVELDKEFERTKKSLEGVAANIMRQNDRARLIGLTLIGSFDPRELKPYLKKRYGENAGLAMARAIWVKNEFVITYNLEASRIATMIGGPGVADLKVNDQATSVAEQGFGERDRAVQVCAIWQDKQ